MASNISIPGLEKGQFEHLPEAKNRLNWSLYGETKTGKSSFPASGAESPVAIFDLDRRLERVAAIEALDAAGLLARFPVKFPDVDPMSRKADEKVRTAANTEWDRFLTHYKMTLVSSGMKGGISRVSIDTATELFDLRLMAEFGRLMGINPRDRGGANAEMVEIMRMPEHFDASVIWLHHSKEEWKNTTDEQGREKSMTTGNIILDGFKKANSVVQIVAKTSYNDTVRDPRKRFEVTVVRCGINAMLNGKKFTSVDWATYDEDADKEDPPIVNYGPLAWISHLAVPGTEPEDWQ
jgi:hypothetical protein